MTPASDRIAYTGPFRQAVQGQLKAQFHLDADGKPIYELDDEEVRHYTMDVYLSTSPAVAKQITRVKYFLDDPSFQSPTGSSDDAANEFRVEITSYGDVEIVVTVSLSGDNYQQRAWLSNMLENGHADNMTPAIRAAIQRIKRR